MTILPQEFDASEIPSLRPCLNSFLENGFAEDVKVTWGKSERYEIIIGVKSSNIRAGAILVKTSERRI